MPPTPVLPVLLVWWSQVVADCSPLHERHGIWYGDGREPRFVRDGFAFSRRFSLISCTSSSIASTSFVCLLGIVAFTSLDDANSNFFLAIFRRFFRWLFCERSIDGPFCLDLFTCWNKQPVQHEKQRAKFPGIRRILHSMSMLKVFACFVLLLLLYYAWVCLFEGARASTRPAVSISIALFRSTGFRNS